MSSPPALSAEEIKFAHEYLNDPNTSRGPHARVARDIIGRYMKREQMLEQQALKLWGERCE